ncbi:DNA circularization N-terminal domain-containing protein [Vibrio diazotrophicus]|uniref:DNA circularization N-terminal domain-containing protein n=1 Tax=Vibrio diazotrophicus TaxID=685 RepID=UPI000C9EB160|nr:DNA circularization N-terminal domain-containing protein [Vibrio diazotrophicus]PNH91337.1 hypothetical protein C1M59_14640 [Vibrio diazotrophicus]
MWERQYEHGRWNGHQLNILATAIDGGQRLHVSEIPYAELPHIRVMGSKARTIKLEVVFVGSSSLADSNAFIANLEESPTGELEHPWLGELPLVYEAFSQSISTKRGIVTLSLSFVRAGTEPNINVPSIVRTKQLATVVENTSASSFANDVSKMSVAEINQTQNDFTEALDVLTDITHRINSNIDQTQGGLADNQLKDIYRTINKAYTAVGRLASQPDYFSDAFSSAMGAVADGVQSEPDSESEAIDNSRNAQQLLLNQVKDDAVSSHYNTQMVTGAIKVSKDLVKLEKEDRFDVTSTTKQPDIIQSDLSALIDSLDERIDDVTQVSTAESMELFDALLVLKSNVQTQYDKVDKGTAPHRVVHQPRFKPALSIAHDQYTNEQIITAINALQHPLFMRGDIAVRDAL